MTERTMNQILAEDNFDWKDMVLFALDDHLEKMMTEMVQEGSLMELDEDEISGMAAVIESRVRDAIGKPLQKFQLQVPKKQNIIYIVRKGNKI